MSADVFTLRFPGTVLRELKKVSKEEKVPMGQLVREAVERYIAIRRFRALRRKALPFAESQGLLTDEDVFKNVS